jgi:hypothetical protein
MSFLKKLAKPNKQIKKTSKNDRRKSSLRKKPLVGT